MKAPCFFGSFMLGYIHVSNQEKASSYKETSGS